MERRRLIKRLEEILIDKAILNQRRRSFVEEALDHFHSQLNIPILELPQWSLSTAMYYSGWL